MQLPEYRFDNLPDYDDLVKERKAKARKDLIFGTFILLCIFVFVMFQVSKSYNICQASWSTFKKDIGF